MIRSESSDVDGGIGKAREALELMRALQRMINALMSFSPDGGIGTGGGSGFLIRMYERVFNDYIRNSIIAGIGQAAGNDPGQEGTTQGDDNSGPMIACEDCEMMDGGDGDGKRNNKRTPRKYETDYEREKLDAAPQIEPLGDGFWEQLDYYLSGRKVNGIYYDKDGTPKAVAPVTGTPPDFFGPGKALKIGRSINQLNKLIKTGKVPRGIIRFDKGRGTKNLPFDEVHFKDGSSLYKNGTWRHFNGHKITNDQLKFLRDNGWTIP